MEETKNYKTKWILFLLSPLFVVILWILISLWFWTLWSLAGELSASVLVIKKFLNWILGILIPLSIVIWIPFGIYFLNKKSMNTNESMNPTETPLVINFNTIRKEAWEQSWTKRKAMVFFWNRITIFIGLVLLFGSLWFLFGSLYPQPSEDMLSLFEAVLRPLWGIFETIIKIGFVGLAIVLVKGGDITFKDYRKQITRSRCWKTLIGSILYWLIIFGGILLFIIPGIFWSVRLSFFMYAVIDKDLWPIEALKWSWKITKWHFREIIIFGLYFGFFTFLGLLCLGIWLIWTLPMALIAKARYYTLLCKLYEIHHLQENYKE